MVLVSPRLSAPGERFSWGSVKLSAACHDIATVCSWSGKEFEMVAPQARCGVRSNRPSPPRGDLLHNRVTSVRCRCRFGAFIVRPHAQETNVRITIPLSTRGRMRPLDSALRGLRWRDDASRARDVGLSGVRLFGVRGFLDSRVDSACGVRHVGVRAPSRCDRAGGRDLRPVDGAGMISGSAQQFIDGGTATERHPRMTLRCPAVARSR